MKTESKTKNEWQEVAEAQQEIILNQSAQLEDLEQRNRSNYIWMFILGLISAGTLLILIF